MNAELNKRKISILLLQECFYDDHIGELSDFIEIEDFISSRGKRWVRIFLNTRVGIDYFSATAYANNKLRCVEIKTNCGYSFNLGGVHLHSKSGKSDSQQLFDNEDIPRFIEEFELQKTSNSIIVGDLNYQPFDISLAHPNFLNTVSDRSIIEIFKSREVKGRDVRYFYNPMWNVLGDYAYDHTSKPSGTYYWYPNDVNKIHWNLIDGVLLSPSVMNCIVIESIIILQRLNGKPLIKSTIVKYNESLLETGYSDHLPLSFSIKLS